MTTPSKLVWSKQYLPSDVIVGGSDTERRAFPPQCGTDA